MPGQKFIVEWCCAACERREAGQTRLVGCGLAVGFRVKRLAFKAGQLGLIETVDGFAAQGGFNRLQPVALRWRAKFISQFQSLINSSP